MATAETPKRPDDNVQWDEVECRQKAQARGDLTFTLVGQDLSSPRTIAFWIMENIETNRLLERLAQFLGRTRMRALQNRKAAD